MTTKVKIINESDIEFLDNHIIEVTGGDGSKSIVVPGKFVEVHVWQGTEILITEVTG